VGGAGERACLSRHLARWVHAARRRRPSFAPPYPLSRCVGVGVGGAGRVGVHGRGHACVRARVGGGCVGVRTRRALGRCVGVALRGMGVGGAWTLARRRARGAVARAPSWHWGLKTERLARQDIKKLTAG